MCASRPVRDLYEEFSSHFVRSSPPRAIASRMAGTRRHPPPKITVTKDHTMASTRALRPSIRPALESLEGREVPTASAVLSNGILHLGGTSNIDQVHIVQQGTDLMVNYQVPATGETSTAHFSTTQVQSI